MKLAAGLLALALAGCESRLLPPLAPLPVSASLRTVVKSAANRYAVPIGLVRAVIMAESGGRRSAVSPVGAQGLMQLMPATAAECGVTNVFDAFQNVDCGTWYLRKQLDRYGGNVRFALAAYNAGPGAVDKYHGVPPYAETQTYVAHILATYH